MNKYINKDRNKTRACWKYLLNLEFYPKWKECCLFVFKKKLKHVSLLILWLCSNFFLCFDMFPDRVKLLYRFCNYIKIVYLQLFFVVKYWWNLVLCTGWTDIELLPNFVTDPRICAICSHLIHLLCICCRYRAVESVAHQQRDRTFGLTRLLARICQLPRQTLDNTISRYSLFSLLLLSRFCWLLVIKSYNVVYSLLSCCLEQWSKDILCNVLVTVFDMIT